jgi:hypothetical protein
VHERLELVGRERERAEEPAAACITYGVVYHVQMTAWGSLARDVPRRNFRSFSFVSGEKVYSFDSEACMVCQAIVL